MPTGGGQVAEGADGAGDASGDGVPDRARQAPPDCRPDDNRTAEEEQSDSVSPQGWVDLFTSGPIRRTALPRAWARAVTMAAIPSNSRSKGQALATAS